MASIDANVKSGLKNLRQRRRLVSTLGLAFAIGGSQIVLAATGVLTARWLGPSGKGLVAGASSWAQALGWLGSLGVAVATQVRVARVREEDRRLAIGSALGNGLVYSLLAGGVVATVAFLPLQRALAHLGRDSFATVALVLVPLPLSMLATMLSLLQLGLGRNARYAASVVTGPAVTLILALAVHLSSELTPVTLAGCYIPGTLVGLAVSSSRLPWRAAHVDLPSFRTDLRLGLRMWVPGAMGFANFRLDLLVMATILAARDVGLYSAATSVMLPIIALPTALIQLAAVTTARADVSTGRVASLASLRRDATVAFAAAAAAGAAVAIASPFVLPRLLGPAYEGVVPLVWVLLFGYVGRAVSGVIAAGANGLELPEVGIRAEGAGLVVTLIALPLLLPMLGTTGAAITSTAAYLTAAVVAARWLRRQSDGRRQHGDVASAPELAMSDVSREGAV